MKILIVSTYFPPQNSIASLRPYSWAKYWSRLGHDITVLTTKKVKTQNDLKLDMSGFCVLEALVTIPFKEIYESKIRNSEIPNNNPIHNWESFVLKFMRDRYSSFVRLTGCFMTCRYPDWHDNWVPRALKLVQNEDWDAVISTGGPYSVHRVGLKIKKQSPNVYWIVDWRDLWTDNPIYHGIPIFWPIEKRLEKRFHKSCDLITCVTQKSSKVLEQKAGGKVEVVYNGFDPDNYKSSRQCSLLSNKSALNIAFTGTFSSKYRLPSLLFEAMHELKIERKINSHDLKLTFVGHNTQELGPYVSKYELNEYCDLFGLVPREDALSLQRCCDILLFSENERIMKDVMSGKIFEYLFSMTPIWAFGISESSEVGQLISRNKNNHIFSKDVNEIKEKILESINIKKNNGKIEKSTINEWLLEYSREHQVNRLMEIIERNIQK